MQILSFKIPPSCELTEILPQFIAAPSARELATGRDPQNVGMLIRLAQILLIFKTFTNSKQKNNNPLKKRVSNCEAGGEGLGAGAD
jgi:hypothetical protein